MINGDRENMGRNSMQGFCIFIKCQNLDAHPHDFLTRSHLSALSSDESWGRVSLSLGRLTTLLDFTKVWWILSGSLLGYAHPAKGYDVQRHFLYRTTLSYFSSICQLRKIKRTSFLPADRVLGLLVLMVKSTYRALSSPYRMRQTQLLNSFIQTFNWAT